MSHPMTSDEAREIQGMKYRLTWDLHSTAIRQEIHKPSHLPTPQDAQVLHLINISQVCAGQHIVLDLAFCKWHCLWEDISSAATAILICGLNGLCTFDALRDV